MTKQNTYSPDSTNLLPCDLSYTPYLMGFNVLVMETKKCNVCGENKLLGEFYKRHLSCDGLSPRCKVCDLLKALNYSRTKIGLITCIYSTQRYRTKLRNYQYPEYTKQELKEWLFSQPLFHKLYDKWVKSGYDRGLSVSIDRIDDYKSYTFDNIQLMTWKENIAKSHKDRKNGINNKTSKAVYQYDLSGNFIKEYYSISQAGRETNADFASISKVCRRNHINKTAGGYIWKYKNKQWNSLK